MGDTDEVVVVPIIPGMLTLAQIAELAGVGVTTIRGYHATKAAGFPKSSFRSGNSPLWAVDDVVHWLQGRPLSPTSVTTRPDGTLVVTRPSDYRERKATGQLRKQQGEDAE